jgi:hypothetical protein
MELHDGESDPQQESSERVRRPRSKYWRVISWCAYVVLGYLTVQLLSWLLPDAIFARFALASSVVVVVLVVISWLVPWDGKP